jgi:hypothetical protein
MFHFGWGFSIMEWTQKIKESIWSFFIGSCGFC